jgi:hypothetical protein
MDESLMLVRKFTPKQALAFGKRLLAEKELTPEVLYRKKFGFTFVVIKIHRAFVKKMRRNG